MADETRTGAELPDDLQRWTAKAFPAPVSLPALSLPLYKVFTGLPRYGGLTGNRARRPQGGACGAAGRFGPVSPAGPESVTSAAMTSLKTTTDWVEISDSAALPAKPLVSVSMITYNHGPYIAEAIEGVIAQETTFPIELIIGEDCSTDNTRQVVLEYQRRYRHVIRVICPNRNVGMHVNGRRVL